MSPTTRTKTVMSLRVFMGQPPSFYFLTPFIKDSLSRSYQRYLSHAHRCTHRCLRRHPACATRPKSGVSIPSSCACCPSRPRSVFRMRSFAGRCRTFDPLSEKGQSARGKNEVARFTNALCRACETRAGLLNAMAWHYVLEEDAQPSEQDLDRMAAMLWGLVHRPRRAR